MRKTKWQQFHNVKELRETLIEVVSNLAEKAI